MVISTVVEYLLGRVRKSHSLRSSASSFKPSSQQAAAMQNNPGQNPYSVTPNNINNNNPYAQPIRSATRSHSTVGGTREGLKTKSKKNVEEIQKVRTQLKSSKSYPNDFLAMNNPEDGDNSSSGVSSDQDVPVGPPTGFDDGRSSEGSGGSEGAQSDLLKPQNPVRQKPSLAGGMLTRHAVSLAQLPPPLEGEGEGEGELVVPPPPEFLGAAGNNGTTEEVLAPPPQFCDNRLFYANRELIPKWTPNKTRGKSLYGDFMSTTAAIKEEYASAGGLSAFAYYCCAICDGVPPLARAPNQPPYPLCYPP
uniref:Uncharacterized protein n=1 Tax=Timema cristinae TaxID=61476 RepID=A0A7R9GXS4_TIMCR|nr:unnamed protein product [Timema cristinae]